MITLSHIRIAARNLPDSFVFTPCVRCDALSRITGGNALLKLENLQPSGAYKIRAAYHALVSTPEVKNGVAVSSSGNLAKAFAYAGRILGIPIVAVMMERTARTKVDAVRALGAEVVLCENRHQARFETLDALQRDRGLTVINHYENDDCIAGHGTIGLEILQQAPDTELVLVPASSGGLLAGVATAVKSLNPKARVVGVQPDLSRAVFESFRAGHPVAVGESRSICDAVVATRPGELPFRHIEKYVDDVVLVSDDTVLEAMRLLARESALVVEPAGALTAAAVLEGKVAAPGKTAVLVVSGGNVAPEAFAAVLLGGRPDSRYPDVPCRILDPFAGPHNQ